VSSPSDPQPPVEHEGRTQSSTQEIPVVQPTGATVAGQHAAPPPLPPHPGAVAPVPVDQPEPTGPVDFVPGLPGTPPVPPPAAPSPPQAETRTDAVVWPDTLEADDSGRPAKVRRIGAPRDRAAVLGIGLAVLALVLLELGLALDFGAQSYWSAVPLWSAFATLCAVLGVLAFAAAFPSGNRLRSGSVWRIAAAGLVGLAVFWVLVVLPVVASDRGFLLTAALGALGAAVWVGPGRKA
jgi:hypothetical protein